MRRALVLLVIACRGRDPIEAALLARGPAPSSTSPDGARVLVESPTARGVRAEVIAGGATIAARDGEPMIAPVWRGDGAAIAYFQPRHHHHAYELHVWDLAAGDRRLAVPVTTAAFARFAPDGRIAYLASDAAHARVLTIAGGAALIAVAEHAEAEWAPDGARLATAAQASPGALTVVDLRGGATTIPIVDGELRDLAWSPDGATVAVTGRARGDAYLHVFRVRLADRTVEALPRDDGDAHAPRFVGGALAYEVERDGERRIALAGGVIGRAGASARLVGYDGAPVVLYRPRTGPAYLDRAPAPGTGTPASRIAIPAGDGTALPAYLWRARAAVGAVVIVHGGPALHATPAWHERTQLLVDAGLDVIKLDYRGSTGHGAAFEALGADPAGQIADVAAARDWAVRALGLAADRVIVVGESYGAGLVAASPVAAASPIVLISTQPLPAAPHPACAVRAFHGADDDISPPDAARAALARLFGAGARWRLLPEEGHNLSRTTSWAIVYRAILALRDQRCGPDREDRSP